MIKFSQTKFVVSVLLGIFCLFGGALITSAEETPASNSAGYYFLFLTNSKSSNASIGVSNKYSSSSSCLNDQKVATNSSGIQLAVGCTKYPKYEDAEKKASLMLGPIRKDIEKKAGPAELENFKCGGLNLEIMGCFPRIVYYFIYKPTQYFLMGSGYLFDTMLNLSIRKEFVSDPPFIEKSWKIVRDFSNMIFIFVLLYTGVSTILGAKGWEKTVRNVIIIALLINFSLFFTKVVIDAGNILAVGVYESIKSGSSSLSEGLSGKFQPQSFLGAAGEVSDAMDAIVVFLLASVISGYAGYIFFKAALLFLGRLIAFWGLMIVSPFAFISIALPKGSIFNKWLDTLINQAFVAPVYLFFIYIILQIVNAGILDGTQMTGSWLFDKLLTPIIIGVLIILAMQKALALATTMAGDFGKGTSDLISKPLGLAGTVALGAATGGTALLARSTIGRAAQGLAESGALARLATGDNAFGRFAGRQAINLADKARTGTWDVAGTKVGKATIGKAASAFGVKLEGPGEGAKDGFKGSMERQSKHDLEVAKKLKMTDEEKGKIEGYTKEKAVFAEKDFKEKVDAEKEAKKAVETSAGGFGKLAKQEALIKATRERDDAEKVHKKAQEEEKKAKDKIAEENARRRGVYAQDTRSKVRTGMMWATGNLAYSHAEAKRSADKLRSKTVAEEEGEEKKKKDLTETLKKLTEETGGKKEEKKEGKPEKKDEEKEEKAH